MISFWNRLFFREESSASLSVFRIWTGVALAVHLFPSLIWLRENYLASGYHDPDPDFFPARILNAAGLTPDMLVWIMAAGCLTGWAAFFSLFPV